MIRLLSLIALLAITSPGAIAQSSGVRPPDLEPRVSKLEGKMTQASAAGTVAFLFGAFCALWAQNSGRSSWLWFFLGFFFSVIAVLVLLSKNSADLDSHRGARKKPFDLQDFRQQ